MAASLGRDQRLLCLLQLAPQLRHLVLRRMDSSARRHSRHASPLVISTPAPDGQHRCWTIPLHCRGGLPALDGLNVGLFRELVQLAQVDQKRLELPSATSIHREVVGQLEPKE